MSEEDKKPVDPEFVTHTVRMFGRLTILETQGELSEEDKTVYTEGIKEYKKTLASLGITPEEAHRRTEEDEEFNKWCTSLCLGKNQTRLNRQLTTDEQPAPQVSSDESPLAEIRRELFL